jgi:hypothetical protein
MTHQFEINKEEFTVGFDDGNLFFASSINEHMEFKDIKEMTLFVNKLSDLLEKELNEREKEAKANGNN